jgi:hypothetical protein
LRYDDDLRVGHVRKRFQWRILVADNARNDQQACHEEYEEPVLERKAHDTSDEFVHEFNFE